MTNSTHWTLAERAAKIHLGDPLDEATQMGPLVSAVQLLLQLFVRRLEQQRKRPLMQSA